MGQLSHQECQDVVCGDGAGAWWFKLWWERLSLSILLHSWKRKIMSSFSMFFPKHWVKMLGKTLLACPGLAFWHWPKRKKHCLCESGRQEASSLWWLQWVPLISSIFCMLLSSCQSPWTSIPTRQRKGGPLGAKMAGIPSGLRVWTSSVNSWARTQDIEFWLTIYVTLKTSLLPPSVSFQSCKNSFVGWIFQWFPSYFCF